MAIDPHTKALAGAIIKGAPSREGKCMKVGAFVFSPELQVPVYCHPAVFGKKPDGDKVFKPRLKPDAPLTGPWAATHFVGIETLDQDANIILDVYATEPLPDGSVRPRATQYKINVKTKAHSYGSIYKGPIQTADDRLIVKWDRTCLDACRWVQANVKGFESLFIADPKAVKRLQAHAEPPNVPARDITYEELQVAAPLGNTIQPESRATRNAVARAAIVGATKERIQASEADEREHARETTLPRFRATVNQQGVTVDAEMPLNPSAEFMTCLERSLTLILNGRRDGLDEATLESIAPVMKIVDYVRNLAPDHLFDVGDLVRKVSHHKSFYGGPLFERLVKRVERILGRINDGDLDPEWDLDDVDLYFIREPVDALVGIDSRAGHQPIRVQTWYRKLSRQTTQAAAISKEMEATIQ